MEVQEAQDFLGKYQPTSGVFPVKHILVIRHNKAGISNEMDFRIVRHRKNQPVSSITPVGESAGSYCREFWFQHAPEPGLEFGGRAERSVHLEDPGVREFPCLLLKCTHIHTYNSIRV